VPVGRGRHAARLSEYVSIAHAGESEGMASSRIGTGSAGWGDLLYKVHDPANYISNFRRI